MLRVSKRFAKKAPVLSDIHLSVHVGEFVSIEGEAGEGKSTLLRLMALREKPTQGQMVVDGADVSTLPARHAFVRARRLICISPADAFFPKLNLRDNLSLAVDMARPPAKPGPQQCQKALAWLGLEGLWRQKPPQLTYTQRLRLLLLRALIRQPRLLLVDGCLDALPEAEFQTWLSLLRGCHEEGTTVITAGRRPVEAPRRLRLSGGFLHAPPAADNA